MAALNTSDLLAQRFRAPSRSGVQQLGSRSNRREKSRHLLLRVIYSWRARVTLTRAGVSPTAARNHSAPISAREVIYSLRKCVRPGTADGCVVSSFSIARVLRRISTEVLLRNKRTLKNKKNETLSNFQ